MPTFKEPCWVSGGKQDIFDIIQDDAPPQIKMDNGFCALIYFDPRACSDRIVRDHESGPADPSNASLPSETSSAEDEDVGRNIRALLRSFSEGEHEILPGLAVPNIPVDRLI